MANIEINRPFFCFNDDGELEGFDAEGKKVEPTNRTLKEVLDAHPGKQMEIKTISVVMLRDPLLREPSYKTVRASGPCYEWQFIDGIGWVWIEVPCP
jgi:hypothetical protein